MFETRVRLSRRRLLMEWAVGKPIDVEEFPTASTETGETRLLRRRTVIRHLQER